MGLTAALGDVGGGISGGAAAKANGSGMWFGTQSKPSVSVIAGKIDNSFDKGMKDYEAKAFKTQSKPTSMSNSSNASQFDGLPSDGLKVHGNSLNSTKPTWGYKLHSNDGTFLKNGITNKIVPETRYTQGFMSDKFMKSIPFPNRLEAYKWEFQQNQILRGPLNLNMH